MVIFPPHEKFSFEIIRELNGIVIVSQSSLGIPLLSQLEAILKYPPGTVLTYWALAELVSDMFVRIAAINDNV